MSTRVREVGQGVVKKEELRFGSGGKQTFELFAPQYCQSSYTKIHRILLGLNEFKVALSVVKCTACYLLAVYSQWITTSCTYWL